MKTALLGTSQLRQAQERVSCHIKTTGQSTETRRDSGWPGLLASVPIFSGAQAQVTDFAGYNRNMNSAIYAVALQDDGEVLLGGNLTTVDGTAKSFLARLHADGTLDTGF